MVDELGDGGLWEARAKRYQAVHDGSPDGMMIFGAVRDAGGLIVDFEWLYSNASASRIVGRSAQDLIGKRLLVEMPGNKDAGLFEIYVRVVETGEPHQHEFPYRHEGLDHWFRSTSSKLDDGFYVAFADLTARKRAEEQLAQLAAIRERLAIADRLASIGTLAAGAAHEVNNPLTTVTVNLDLAIEDVRELAGGSPSGRLKELDSILTEARAGADRIRRIIRGLMTFSRTDDERRVAIELKPVLELAVNLASVETRGRARVVVDCGQTPRVLADDTRLGQVFVNLIANAAQSISEGDFAANEIRIATSTDEHGGAVIEVHDTGAGIPAAIIGRIFDPFFTTKPVGGGTGLGLSICRNIVAGIGGEISVTSRAGGGTTVRVVLPPAPAPAPAAHEASTSPPTAAAVARPGSVLVIDDELAVGKILTRVLRAHRVTVVTRAQDALDLIGAEQHFDVILSDLMMPEMTGMAFYDELARRYPAIAQRTVFISGGVTMTGVSGFLDRVPNERLEKPFDAVTVRALVQRFVK